MNAAVMVKECRKFRGYTQKELAEKAGVSVSSISGIESGKLEPKLRTVELILDACGFMLDFTIKERRHD